MSAGLVQQVPEFFLFLKIETGEFSFVGVDGTESSDSGTPSPGLLAVSKESAGKY